MSIGLIECDLRGNSCFTSESFVSSFIKDLFVVYCMQLEKLAIFNSQEEVVCRKKLWLIKQASDEKIPLILL